MKHQVFYIHGGESYSNYEDFIERLRTGPIYDLPSNEQTRFWTSTLALNLGGNYEVFTPKMPNSQNAKYEEWKIWFERHFEYLRNDIVLLGWSLGGYFFTKYLIENRAPVKIKALFLIAAPFQSDDFGGEDGGDFAFDTSRVGELAKKVEKIHLFHSTDDFVVPYEHALKYQKSLPGAELHTFNDKNHFLIPEFPELIEKIKSI